MSASDESRRSRSRLSAVRDAFESFRARADRRHVFCEHKRARCWHIDPQSTTQTVLPVFQLQTFVHPHGLDRFLWPALAPDVR